MGIGQGGTVEQYLAHIKSYQQHVTYAHLFTSEEAIYRQERPGSELVVVAREHRTLMPAEMQALGEFRLHQYVLWGWFDGQKVRADPPPTDPSLSYVPPQAIHVLVGTTDGHILAYFVMQEAVLPNPFLPDGEYKTSTPPRPEGRYLTDGDRPLFVAEEGLFGLVFNSLPALQQIPLSRIAELTCLLSNRALISPLSLIASTEAIYTMTLLSMRSRLRAILGSIDAEARRLTATLGVPVLYAPQAPVVTRYPTDSKSYWSEKEYEPGRFWPFVIAVEDLYPHTEHFRRLDEMLAGSPGGIRRALVQLQQHGQRLPPHAFVPPDGASPLLWTADPFWEQRIGLGRKTGEIGPFHA